MKSLILSFLLLSFVSVCCIQRVENLDLNNEYFLIGTLRDYMGREKYPEIENRIDRYYQHEKKLCWSIDSMFKESYPDLRFSSKKHPTTQKDEFELHSELLAREIENFYYYQPSGRHAYSGEANPQEANLNSLAYTKDFLITQFDTIFAGRLRSDVFKTERQKMSFITGAYVRYGGGNDSTHYISVFNSTSKVRVLDKLLQEVGCTNVAYRINDHIPVGHTVYFIPTDKLRSYFGRYMNLR